MNYVAVRRHGKPNGPDGEYKTGIGLLYWQTGQQTIDYADKENFEWIAMMMSLQRFQGWKSI